MSRRWLNILVGTVSLLLGCLFYICFRETTYVALAFGKMALVADLQQIGRSYSCHFVRYYFPDFLWGLSLGCFLQAIHLPNKWGCVSCSAVVCFLGIFWEVLQHTKIVSGTGDLLDVLMYLSAGFCVAIINYKGSKI